MKTSLMLFFAALGIAIASPTPKPSWTYINDGSDQVLVNGGNRWSLGPDPYNSYNRLINQWNRLSYLDNLVPQYGPTTSSASSNAISTATSTNLGSPALVRQRSSSTQYIPVPSMSTLPLVSSIGAPSSQVSSSAAATASAVSGNGLATNYGWTTLNPALSEQTSHMRRKRQLIPEKIDVSPVVTAVCGVLGPLLEPLAPCLPIKLE